MGIRDRKVLKKTETKSGTSVVVSQNPDGSREVSVLHKGSKRSDAWHTRKDK